MSKSHKTHKIRLQKFKQKQQNLQRMSEILALPENPIAEQYPVWNSQDTIEMKGIEFEAIYALLNVFRNAVIAGETILQRNLQNGKIKYVFKDKEGKDVPQDVVEKYQADINKFIAAQQAAQEQKGVPNLNAIVGANGEPIKAE